MDKHTDTNKRAFMQSKNQQPIKWNSSDPDEPAMYSMSGRNDAELFDNEVSAIEHGKKQTKKRRNQDFDDTYNKYRASPIPDNLSRDHISRTPTPTFDEMKHELEEKGFINSNKKTGNKGGKRRSTKKRRSKKRTMKRKSVKSRTTKRKSRRCCACK
mgnify:CR=1 FL=1